MSKTITVTGTGHATAKPNQVVISMSLESCDKAYDKAMEIASDSIAAITQSLMKVGFEKNSLKTIGFQVRTNYENMKDRSGNYHRVFDCYGISHSLRLEFSFDMKRLSAALAAIADSSAHPQLSIAFTVKDAAPIKEEMLRSATANARKSAETLCEASGVKLGELISIHYSWSELNICSNTSYSIGEDCLYAPGSADGIDIEPDDIEVRDTATFVWEI